ncbi:MAG: Serine/threonine protein kinase PrkC, regulator of stationary phase [Myxococcaceae bacterium]|nr:Serine/threonine protein kinase PrkC, regulator of stationary phase [Myxococcaceae bacterium]
MDTLSEKPPRFIGKYEVRGELGHGGMAVVYRAHDPTLDRDVAIKVLHPHLAQDPESRMRFEREAKAAARLRHPNIVEVYEFSGDTDEASFMVTEILGGPTLRKFIEGRDPLPSEVAAAIGIVLCDALMCAHAQGVVHRDVKPDNLMLSKGKLKLTDFGIAHVADQREMTATGQVLGSPAHMAPEQIEGTLVDARTDIFAAGTVLYLLATGRLPFDGPNPHSLLRKILDGDYPDPLRSAPRIGHRYAAIVRRAMARIPDDRFPDASALRHALLELCAEVGWDDPVRELDRYFADPHGVTAKLHATLIAKLPALGLAARSRGDVSEAMGYFNRALALDPGNTKVLALVREQARAHRRRRTMRAATIVAAAALGSTVGGLTLSWMFPPVAPPMVANPTMQRVRTAPEVVPAQIAATARPVAPADVPTVASAAPVRTATRPPDRRSTDAPAAPVVMRDVRIAPTQQNVMYSVNGDHPRSFSTHDMPLHLPVGQRARIRFFLDGYQDYTWERLIEPGDTPITVNAHLRQVPIEADTSTRAEHP